MPVHAELTDANGLVEIRSRGMTSSDPYWVPRYDGDPEPRRANYDLVLRGRPDIHPGDFVEFTRPPEESDGAKTPNQFSLDLLDEVSPGEPVRLYVQGVTHSLSRDRPFLTVVRGVSTPSWRSSCGVDSHGGRMGLLFLRRVLPGVLPAASIATRGRMGR